MLVHSESVVTRLLRSASRHALLALVIVLAILASGCETTKPLPTKVFVQSAPPPTPAEIKKVVIISDVCLTDDDNFISLNMSRQAEKLVLAAAKKVLESKGFTVVALQSPFVGGFKDPNIKCKIAGDANAPSRDALPPFAQDAEFSGDAELQGAVQRLQYFTQLCFDKGFNRSARFSVNPHAREAARIIALHTGADAILLVNGNGRIISLGKAVTQAVLSSVISATLTLGTVVVTQYDLTFIDSYVALIDARSGQLVWSNSIRLVKPPPPNEEECYKELWPYNALYWTPDPSAPAQSATQPATLPGIQPTALPMKGANP